MSNFLPERQAQPIPSIPPPSGLPDEKTRGLIQRIFGSPNAIPATFWAYAKSMQEADQPMIPFSSVFGAPLVRPHDAPRVNTAEATTSTAYTNLATVGPELTGLPDGLYVIWFGSGAKTTNVAAFAFTGLQVNGVDPADDSESTESPVVAGYLPGSTVVVKTLAGGGNNTLRLRYRIQAVPETGTFNKRFLIALRAANA